MDRSRRNFCLGAGAATVGAATLAAVPADAGAVSASGDAAHRWAMVVDVRK